MGWTAKDLANKGGRKTAKVKTLPVLMPGDTPKPIAKEGEVTKTGATIYVKPLSANRAYKGKIFKTEYHKNYIVAVTLMLPNNIVIPDGFLSIEYELGFGSHGSDLDNPLKTLGDILAAKYGFNDNRIMMATVRKQIVPKGKEYVKFNITKYDKI